MQPGACSLYNRHYPKGIQMTVLVLIHTILFLLFWLTNLSFQQDMNEFLADATGLQVDFLLIFLLFSFGIALWSAARLALRKKPRKPNPSWPFNSFGGFYLVFFYGSFIVLFIKNPVQVARLGQLLQYFRIFPDAILLLLAVWGLRLLLGKMGRLWQKALLIFAFLVLWLAPVFWTPGLVYHGALPQKPRLMAHRGASTLAPENTLASMQIASRLGVYGLETDITVSYDGTLFLMHDSTLARTTDVLQIFPGREKDPADRFTWGELSQLDAGQWFIGRALYQDEPIPSFGEILRIVHENHLHLIFDLRTPSVDHPFADQTLSLCLAEIQAAGVASQTWVLAGLDEIPIIRATLPGAVLAKGLDYGNAPAPEELSAAGYQLVNSEFGLSNWKIRAYEDAGLWVNIWTVDQPWQYSRLWLAGADSVTSNNIQAMIALSRPVMAMSYSIYLLVWGLIRVVAATLVAIRRK
jgi:glycerophosphoryl diester phosphodiesterase